MAQKAVVDAVMARLGATFAAGVWTGTWNGLAIVEMNTTGETDAAGSEFLAVQFPVARDERPTVNQPFYREEGGFRLLMQMSRGVGLTDALTKAGTLAALFRDQSFGGVKCEVPSSPFFDDSNDQGNFFRVSIVCPFSYNFT